MKNRGETIEKELKDYKGYKILIVIDNKGLSTEVTTYIAYTQTDDLYNATNSLAKLKKQIDEYTK